jgi:hypothetical protein
MAENFPFPIPISWYAVAYSDELEGGQVLPLSLLGRELVAFRGEDGVAAVLDAYCPHLGAHLGHGGIPPSNATVPSSPGTTPVGRSPASTSPSSRRRRATSGRRPNATSG